MSEESLRQFLDQLTDAAFVERLKANPAEALAGFELSPAERIALGTNDEDGLRRLAGQDVAGFNNTGAASTGGHVGLVNTPCAQQFMTLQTFCGQEQESGIMIWFCPSPGQPGGFP
jgi:hypothetical protein